MNYKLVIFDLDGTLMDTSKGIVNSYQKAAYQFGYQIDHITSYQNIIGGALPDNFKNYFSVKESDIRGIVECYREVYAKEGIYMADHYNGIRELLIHLKSCGFKVAIATLKRQDFAVQMMERFGLSQYFDFICGMDTADSKTKSEIIQECQLLAQVTPKGSVMIGDTTGDQKGAMLSKTDFIGVTYGFGFQSLSNMQDFPYVFMASTPADIADFLK